MSNLRILRKKLRLTQEGLEQRTGVSQAMISTFENSGSGLTMRRVLVLADSLETSVDYLLERTDIITPYPPGSRTGNLRRLRERAHLTQFGLEMRTRIDQSKLSKYERGEALPTAQNAAILADYFRVGIDFLLDRTDVETPYPPKTE